MNTVNISYRGVEPIRLIVTIDSDSKNKLFDSVSVTNWLRKIQIKNDITKVGGGQREAKQGVPINLTTQSWNHQVVLSHQ